MGLILRTSHEPMPPGSTISNTRLTIEQMDSNFIFLQNISTSAIIITHDEAIDLINSNSVLRGRNYLITDCDPTLYGASSSFNFGTGTEIIVQGLDTNSFSSQGYGKFYNPIYYDPNTDEGYDVWNPQNSYNLHDIVIYGGRVWRMTNYTENWGSVDYFNLASDWTPFSYTNTDYYNVVWDEVEYDIIDNYISSRYDVYNNNYVKNNYRTQYFYCNAYPIQSFRWGHRVDIGGIADCNIINSYFGCLNYCGSTNAKIYNVTLENQSTIFDIQLFTDSYFYNIKMNNSVIGSLYFDNSNIYNIVLENGSFFGNMEISNSTIDYINMNDSYFENLDLVDSTLQYINLSNSNFSNNSFNLSQVNNIDILNDSQFLYNNFYSSSLYDIDISNNSIFRNIVSYSSNIFNVNVKENSYFGNIHLNQNDNSNISYISNIEISNNSYISNDDDDIYLDNGSYFDKIAIDNSSYITGWMVLGSFSSLRYLTINNKSIIDGSAGLLLSNYSYLSNILLDNNSRLNGYLTLDNNSSIERINIQNSSNIGYGIHLDNESWIESLEIINDSSFTGWWDTIFLYNSSYISDTTISSDSYLGNLYLGTSSYFSDITITEASTLGYLTLNNNSYICNLTINNDSSLGDYLELDSSYIRYGSISNSSNINNLSLSGSYISNFDIVNSSVETSYLYQNNLINSHLKNLLLNSKSILRDLYLDTSIIEFVNLDNSDFIGVSMSNSSAITSYKSNNSIVANINMNNNSGFYGVNFNNSEFVGNQNDGIGSFLLDGESIVSNVIFNNISIPGVNIGLNLQSNSLFCDSILSNGQIYNISCYNSQLNNLTMNNNSNLYYISLTSSNISHSELNTSSISYLSLDNSYLFGLFLKQSNFNYYNNTSFNLYNLLMVGSSINLGGINNTLLLSNTDMTYNTIKYQFTYNVAGFITNQYNMNVLIPGSGWYIDRVVLNNINNPIVSTGTSFLSLGMYNLNQSYVFNSIDTTVLHGNIKVYDFSNGTLSGSVSTSVDYLNLNVGGDDIYSGSIDFEVILKNTTFFNSND